MEHTVGEQPVVCVFMITYNHEHFIEQAVRSVMVQETDFRYELVIGEDCSTDRTRAIILKLGEEFPEKIRLLLPEQNLGMAGNFAAVYNACRGKYIALLEGDDYWTEPRKLQRQVSFMEANPDCRLCSHNAAVINEQGETLRVQGWDVGALDAARFLQTLTERADHIITGSVLFRSVQPGLPAWFLELKASIDWAFFLWLLTFGGTLRHLDGIPMSVYRLHAGGITHAVRQKGTTLQARQKLMKHYVRACEDVELLKKHMPHDLQSDLNSRLLQLYATTARLAYNADRNVFKAIYQKLCRLSPGGQYIPESPRHLALVSRVVGYPRAEWISTRYRELMPIGWRTRFH